MNKCESLLEQFNKALMRLEEALKEEKTDFIRDSVIKRFEIVFDLSWKLIKAFLEKQGAKCVSPRDCFREAYRHNLIDYEEIWMELIDDRNYTVHIYKEILAERIYADIPKSLALFRQLADKIADKK